MGNIKNFLELLMQRMYSILYQLYFIDKKCVFSIQISNEKLRSKSTMCKGGEGKRAVFNMF